MSSLRCRGVWREAGAIVDWAVMKERKAPRGRSGSSSRVPPEKPEQAFDLWLKKGLHQLFDDVANEPIPPELLRLIEEDKKR